MKTSLIELPSSTDSSSYCSRCGAELTDTTSITRGLGPVCAHLVNERPAGTPWAVQSAERTFAKAKARYDRTVELCIATRDWAVLELACDEFAAACIDFDAVS